MKKDNVLVVRENGKVVSLVRCACGCEAVRKVVRARDPFQKAVRQ